MDLKAKNAPAQPALGDWTTESHGTANISELARAAGLDRATVVKRLEAAGVRPKKSRAKEKQYDVKAATTALGAGNPHPIDRRWHNARTEKTSAEAQRILLKLERERGELAPVAELREQAFILVKALHQRFTRYARESRGRLYRAKNMTEVEQILAGDIALIFSDLKRDYPNIL